jgi:hypothetical protein
VKIAFSDYSTKGARLAGALRAAGHELVDDHGDLAVVDLDHPATGLALTEAHEITVTYPHGGNPILCWDGRPPHPHIRLHLVHGPGHSEVFALHGHPVPSVAVGFTYCEVSKPRYPIGERVLFAPSHPMDDRTIDPRIKEANRAALDKLLAAGVEVTVRCWGIVEDWGLDPDATVTWAEGGTLDTDDIDAADLVVADGTVAAMSLARGCPTLFVGSDIDTADDRDAHPHFDAYRNRIRYPYDIADAPLEELVYAVCNPNELIDGWLDRFVGGPFDADLAVGAIEALV